MSNASDGAEIEIVAEKSRNWYAFSYANPSFLRLNFPKDQKKQEKQEKQKKQTKQKKQKKTHRSRAKLYSTVGTPDYIAPEVLSQRGYGRCEPHRCLIPCFHITFLCILALSARLSSNVLLLLKQMHRPVNFTTCINITYITI